MVVPFQLDVVFTQDGALLSAAAKEFPGCVGVGFNETEALCDMRRAIKIFLKEQVEKAVDRLFTVPIQQQITLGSKSPKKVVSFDISPALGLEDFVQPRKQVMLSFPLPRYRREPQPDAAAPETEIFLRSSSEGWSRTVHNLFEQLGLGLDLAATHGGAIPFVAGQPDGLIVGIPLNFN